MLAALPALNALHNSFSRLEPLDRTDSCDSTLAPVAGETRVKQGGEDCNYLLTRFYISLLSEWFCFLIYFDLLEN